MGAGAGAAKDLPADVVAVGDPARELREITDADRGYPAADLGDDKA